MGNLLLYLAENLKFQLDNERAEIIIFSEDRYAVLGWLAHRLGWHDVTLFRLHRIFPMTYVVTESCIKCKYTDCVEVCPVDCFHEGPNFLVIDPEECIDCAVCEPECPVEAIFSEDELPDDQRDFLALNAELAMAWPVITERKDPLPDAAKWEGVSDKLKHLERRGG